ncbi:MAG: iron chelate uptake ABC transporter family permease subunit [Elusimicrobiales bacterium]|nr:iron chelate uptake ABC transporter family permease subunit [Elusimicrobiales bacterium]
MKKQAALLIIFAAVIAIALLSGQAGADIAVMLHFRLPRILAACIAGASLGLSGALFQGVLKNPLADPYLLGTSAGASAIAALCLVNGIGRTSPVFFIAVFAGAFGGTFISYFIAKAAGKLSDASLVLSGVAVSAFLTALLMFFVNMGGEKAFSLLSFIMGGFSVPSVVELAVSAAMLAAVFIISVMNSRYLDAFSLGEEKAYHLGADPAKGRVLFFMLASAASAAAVSLCGTVGFIGLMVPHIMRLMFSPRGRALLPAAAFGGAILLCAADTAGRAAFSPHEIPAGIIMALCGAPFFLWLLFRSRGCKIAAVISAENLRNEKICAEISENSKQGNCGRNSQNANNADNFQNDKQNCGNSQNNAVFCKTQIIDNLLTNCSYLSDNQKNKTGNSNINSSPDCEDVNNYCKKNKNSENAPKIGTKDNPDANLQKNNEALLSVKNLSFFWKIEKSDKIFISSKKETNNSDIEILQKNNINAENRNNNLENKNTDTNFDKTKNADRKTDNQILDAINTDKENNSILLQNGENSSENQKCENSDKKTENDKTEYLFENLSFEIHSGDFLGILGPNGAGKSTLLKTITGFIKNDAEIYVGGKRRSAYSAAELAAKIAWLPGEIEIPYDFTVRDFAELGRAARFGFNAPLTSADNDAINDAMRMAGIIRFADRNINSLSSGERQLASLALALAQDSDILLLDEPVSHLDLYYKERFMEIVSALTDEKGKAAIAVLHEPALAYRCNKILLLGRGWHYSGSPEDALNPKILAKLYGISENSPLLFN